MIYAADCLPAKYTLLAVMLAAEGTKSVHFLLLVYRQSDQHPILQFAM